MTQSSLDVFADPDTDSLWIPLIVNPDMRDRELLEDVKQQVLAIDSVARSPLIAAHHALKSPREIHDPSSGVPKVVERIAIPWGSL